MENPDPSEPGGGPGSTEETVPPIEESPAIQACLVQQEDGIIDTDYPLGGIALSEEAEELCAIIAIAFVQSKLLVAVPEEAWHRQLTRRRLPSRTLSKAVLCAVGACSKEARGDEEDIIQEIRVWVGFLDRRMESELKFQPDLGLGLHFGSARGEFLVPFGPALVEVANEHFGFVTAESGGPGAPQAPTTVEGRLSQLERMIEGVNANLSSLIGAPSVMAPRPKVRSSQEKNAQARKADRGGGVAGLNPTTVAAALEAGVPMAHLEEMGKILQSKPPRLEDVPRKPTLKKKAGPLEESAEEEEESEGAELIPDDAGGADQKGVIPPQSIEQALLQLTTIATKLTKADQKKDKLDLILEGGSGSAAGSEQSGVPGTRRNAAAVRALQKMLREDPKYLYEHIETNLQADFNGRAPAPGEPWTPGTTVRGWLMSRSRIQNYQNHVRWCWALGGNMGCIDLQTATGGPRQMRAVDGGCRPDLDRRGKLDHVGSFPPGTSSPVPSLQHPQSPSSGRTTAFRPLRREVGRDFPEPLEGDGLVRGRQEEAGRKGSRKVRERQGGRAGQLPKEEGGQREGEEREKMEQPQREAPRG